MKNWMSVLCLILLIQACGKEHFTKIEKTGYLLHAVTYQPIAGVEVGLSVNILKTVPRSAEYPDGKMLESVEFKSTTDASGKFSFLAPKTVFGWSFVWLAKKDWIVSGRKTLTRPPINYNDPSAPVIVPDTIFVERPGYIRYEVNNINDRHTNDSIWVATPYQLQSFAPEPTPPQFPGTVWIYPNMGHYNWLFVNENVSKIITETVPAEKNQDVQVEWAYKRTDTITKVKETIHVAPATTVTYKINY
jgi:hypothetical protein